MTPLADRLRQFYTRFGLRSQRVYLVWTKWTGEERGEGEEQILLRMELLPTPRVRDLNSVSRLPFPVGTLPEGSLVVDQISCGAYTADNLRGLVFPPGNAKAPRPLPGEPVARAPTGDPRSDPTVDFFWEIVEDGRGDESPERHRFRLLGFPSRREGSLFWFCVLEAVSDPLLRDGRSPDEEEDE